MKLVLMITLLIATQGALASQVLHCQGRDKPAQIEVRINQTNPNTYAVALTLTNASFPNGTTGVYTGTFDNQNQQLSAVGAIAGLSPGQSHVVIAGDSKSIGLVLWADGDRRIESGFGANFICH